MAQVEDMLQKMMRRFNASDKNIKELRGDLEVLGKKLIHMQFRLNKSKCKCPIICDSEHTATGHSS